MKKYFLIFKAAQQRALTYKSRMITYALIDGSTPLLMIAVWTGYYAAGGVINGQSLSHLAGYYLAAIVAAMMTSHVHLKVTYEIREGDLVNFIIKPLSYVWSKVAGELGWYTLKIPMAVLPVILFVLLLGVQVETVHNIQDGLLALISLVGSYSLSFIMAAIIGCTAFWVVETTGLTNFYSTMSLLLSGAAVPADFFPENIRRIVEVLPFSSVVYFPAKALTGSLVTTEIVTGLIRQLVWVLVFAVIYNIMWRRGIRKFSAVGR